MLLKAGLITDFLYRNSLNIIGITSLKTEHFMEKDVLKYKTYFDEFEIDNIISESTLDYTLFEPGLRYSETEQVKVFEELEKNLPIYEGSSFRNQVHFQNAQYMPIQRWYPYREGYSVKLVNAFLNELKINGNVFDPFSGSGTT